MRQRLLHDMHAAGLRLDDAAVAAAVAVRSLRDQRDRLILAARAAGLSYRQIARVVGVTHPAVIAVVNRAGVQLPPRAGTV